MVKVTFPPIQHTLEGWDGELEEWRLIFMNGPLPVFETTTFASLPAASSHDRSFAFFNDTTAGWLPAFSDGAAWQKIGHQSAARANSVAATVGALVTDFNDLLAKMRTAGLLAP